MEKDIRIGEQSLHYDETGNPDGRPVILMHGWGCDHTTVRSIAAILENGMHVYNIDLPGHGKSPEPSFVWDVDEYAECIKSFIDKLAINDPVMIGHSFGGRIAIMLASENPWTKMMLVDAAGIKPRRPLKFYLKKYSFKTVRHLLPLICPPKQADKIIGAMRNKFGSADYRQASPTMRAIMSKAVNHDLTHLLPSIKASTLLVWGENDTATPLRDARIMEKKIPDAGLVVFKNVGHYSFLDNAGGFRAVTKEFFKKELAPGS